MIEKPTVTDIVKYAQQRLAVDKDGSWPTPYKSFCDPKKRSTITRLVKMAFVKGYVEVVPANRANLAERLPEAERELIKRFRLRAAVVIQPALHDVDKSDPDAVADAIHSQLGHIQAKLIAHGGVLRDGDSVALSSGRASYHVAHDLAENSFQSALRDVEVISLSGSLNPRHYSTLPNLRLDADYNTQEFARWFGNVVRQRYVKEWLVDRAKSPVERRRNNDALSEAAWKKGVDVAICGVGILRPGHRLYEAITKKLPGFEPIENELQQLIAFSNKYATDFYCPVADIANRLIFVRPVSGIVMPSSDEQKIEALVDRINRQTLTVTEDQLRSIKAIALISGSAAKAAATRQLLGDYNVRYLCTDVEGSEQILNIRDQAGVQDGEQPSIPAAQNNLPTAHTRNRAPQRKKKRHKVPIDR